MPRQKPKPKGAGGGNVATPATAEEETPAAGNVATSADSGEAAEAGTVATSDGPADTIEGPETGNVASEEESEPTSAGLRDIAHAERVSIRTAGVSSLYMAGRTWTKQPFAVDVDRFSREEWEAIAMEPMLFVSVVD